MARCPLCSERSAKRFCPAKDTEICAVCCGTHREVDIDCPSTCIHLKTGQLYESERKPVDPVLANRVQSFGQPFVQQYGPILAMFGQTVAEERRGSSWLVDLDVAEVYKALSATMKTLSSGIYYETLPEGPIRISLFRRLKVLVDRLMEPGGQTRPLRVGEILNMLDFLMLALQLNSSGRPRSRQYLDWLTAASDEGHGPPAESSRLIVP
jgi:hypothetical protein